MYEDGGVGEAADRVRSEILREFVWTGGHADFAAILRSPAVVETIGEALATPFKERAVSVVIGIEARGFIFAALAARALGVGLVLARKAGSVHPGSEVETATHPDWRGRHLVMRVSAKAVQAGDELLLFDDWVETGSQATTVARLVGRLGGEVIGVSAVVDDAPDHVRIALNLVGLVRSSELPTDA